jgi:large subunit ribosomal protein LP2
MRYVAAYLLASLGGKENPNSADIEKILSSVGIEADAEKLKKVLSELNGKNVEELIAAGKQILENTRFKQSPHQCDYNF